MQRLVLAMLLLGMLAGAVALVASGLRATRKLGQTAEAEGPIGGGVVQKLSYVALFLLIVGVATGWLGGL
jgi:hypothetical protein